MGEGKIPQKNHKGDREPEKGSSLKREEEEIKGSPERKGGKKGLRFPRRKWLVKIQ